MVGVWVEEVQTINHHCPWVCGSNIPKNVPMEGGVGRFRNRGGVSRGALVEAMEGEGV
jgi:hypothetical protein